MPRLLLTQSQVSVVLTTIIVTTVTFCLFLAGYTLQQHTIQDLHQTIRPRLPKAPAHLEVQIPLHEELKASRKFGGSEGSSGRVAYQRFTKADDAAAKVDWKKLAHVQLVRTHHEVCNAIMIFGNLASMKSPARRILLFPTAWALEKAEQADSGDPWLETTVRLMRLAARRYGVELRAITPIAHAEGGAAAQYSLTSLVSMVDLDRVMMIESPGVVLDASRFDAMLAFTESVPLAVLQDTSDQDSVHADDIYLVEPSKERHQDVLQRVAAMPDYNDTLFASLFDEPLLLAAETEEHITVRSVGELHNYQDEFNATQFMLSAAYMRFSDPKLPGPEWDVPYEQRREARPVNADADWLWTELYGQFAQTRAEICGLRLEPWRP